MAPAVPAWRQFPIRELLDMTSRIPDYANQPAFEAALLADPSAHFTTAQLVSYVAALPLGPAGYNYSNTDYILAQMIIERVTHDSYASHLTRRIIDPLGLRSTCLAPYTCPLSDAAQMPAGYLRGQALGEEDDALRDPGTGAQRSRSTWSTREVARSEVRKSASAPITTNYHVFLSHAYEDAELIAGIKLLIENDGLSVYVDWIDDPQADRSKVSSATADMLRQRMNNCQFLMFATSKASPDAKWMPRELGYFDGYRRDHVGILPIVESDGRGFLGQEYIGLYPKFELINFERTGRRLTRFTGENQGETLEQATWRM